MSFSLTGHMKLLSWAATLLSPFISFPHAIGQGKKRCEKTSPPDRTVSHTLAASVTAIQLSAAAATTAILTAAYTTEIPPKSLSQRTQV